MTLEKRNSSWLSSFNYFRAIAIIFIVAGHCIAVEGWYFYNSPVKKLVANLVYGGSSLFVFISGFLFHHIYYRKFDYRSFIIKKFKYVFIPYLVLSTIPICYYVFIKRNGPHPEFVFSTKSGAFFEYIKPAILYLKIGVFNPYWYIPFIMVIFLLSPVFIKFIELHYRTRLACVSLLFMVSIVIHRPIHNLSVIQSVVYYTPVYLFGIAASIHKEQIYASLKGKDVYLLFCVLLLALIQVVFYKNFLNFHKDPFEITVPDIQIIQKMLLCMFFMVWLHRFENAQFKFFDLLADASFAIYFLHPIVLIPLDKLLIIVNSFHYRVLTYLDMLLEFPIAIMLSLTLAIIIKNTFPARSRQIIGW